jgi:hypothetical protein
MGDQCIFADTFGGCAEGFLEKCAFGRFWESAQRCGEGGRQAMAVGGYQIVKSPFHAGLHLCSIITVPSILGDIKRHDPWNILL